MEHTAFSYKKELRFSRPLNQAAVKKRADKFLSDLKRFLKKSGCRLIGHVKGIFDSGEDGYLAFSVTSFEEDIHYKGEIAGRIKNTAFLLNVIVYGVDLELIEKEVLHGLKHFDGGK